jgi:hypothetical protein
MVPEVRREGMGYAMTFPEIATEMAADRLVRSRGDVQAHVSVTCGLPGTRSRSGRLHSARLNLSSSSSRSTLARVLKDRANLPGLDWMDVIEEFCRGILELEREGEPVVMVGARPRIVGGVSYRIDPLAPLNLPSILYGEGGSGKSTLAAAFAVSCESGVAAVPGFVPRPGRVLYLDWEGDEEQINERVAGVAAGANLPRPIEIRYRPMVAPIADQVDELARIVDRERIGLVIVDSVGPASGTTSDGADAAESALRLFAAFRFLRTTVLALDHVAKASLDEPGRQARPYGSIFKQNLARSTWEIRRAGEAIALYHTKSNVARLQPPRGLHVQYTEGGSITYAEAMLADELRKPMKLPERIADLLSDGFHREVAQIVEELGMEKEESNKVRVALSRDPRFNKLPSGTWEVVRRAS